MKFTRKQNKDERTLHPQKRNLKSIMEFALLIAMLEICVLKKLI